METKVQHILAKIIDGTPEDGILLEDNFNNLSMEEIEILCSEECNGKSYMLILYEAIKSKFIRRSKKAPGRIEKILPASKFDNLFSPLCSKYAGGSMRIADFLFKIGDYSSLLQNEEFLLSSYYSDILGEELMRLDHIVAYYNITGDFKPLAKIKLSGPLLTYTLTREGGVTLIEFLYSKARDNINCAISWGNITKETLSATMPNGDTILEFLIIKDRELVVNIAKVLELGKRDWNLISILSRNGIKPYIIIDTPELFVQIEQEKKRLFFSRYNLPLSETESSLIDYFRVLMLSDGKSDEALVTLACNSFREQISAKRPYAIRDLKSFLVIKSSYPNFSLRRLTPEAKKEYNLRVPCFNRDLDAIFLDDEYNIDDFNHEAGHALHYYVSRCSEESYSIPDFFDNSHDFSYVQLKKIVDYFKLRKERLAKFRKQVADRLSQFYRPLLNKYMSVLIMQQIQKRILALNSTCYSPGVISYLNNQPISIEDFYNILIANNSNEHVAKLDSIYYGIDNQLSDIFDALSDGLFFTDGIPFEDDYIIGIAGHGVSYFKDTPGFIEIIADYIAIIKSPKADELIGVLADVMGQEFVDALRVFYDNLHFDDKAYKLIGGTGHGL